MFETLKMFDSALLLKINSMHTPLMDTVMWIASQSWHTYLLVLFLAYGVYKKYSMKKAAEFVLGCALVIACTDMSSNLIKHNVKRYRPTHNLVIKDQLHIVEDYRGGKFGFFSGHAANNFALTTFIFLCFHWVKSRQKFILFLYPVVISYSRMYLGVHYPSDVLVGMIYGTCFGFLIYLIVNRYFLKFNAASTQNTVTGT